MKMSGKKYRIMSLDLLNKLNKVAQETSCTLFNLSINPEGKWKMYILQSRILLIGDFEHVATAAIEEFENNREPLKDRPKNHRLYENRKYRYNAIPKVASVEMDQEEKASVYSQKLKFCKSLGYTNFADCLSNMGMAAFNSGFKGYQKKG